MEKNFQLSSGFKYAELLSIKILFTISRKYLLYYVTIFYTSKFLEQIRFYRLKNKINYVYGLQ